MAAFGFIGGLVLMALAGLLLFLGMPRGGPVKAVGIGQAGDFYAIGVLTCFSAGFAFLLNSILN